MHVPIGKVSFDAPALLENYLSVLDELNRAKPAAAKGRYLKGVAVVVDDGSRGPHRSLGRRDLDDSANGGRVVASPPDNLIARRRPPVSNTR